MHADSDASLEDLLIRKKKMFNSCKGIGFGCTHLAKDADIVAANAEQPAEIVFNYLGNTASDIQKKILKTLITTEHSLEDEILAFVGGEESVEVISPNRQREYPIGLNGSVVDGELYFEIDYNSNQYSEARYRTW